MKPIIYFDYNVFINYMKDINIQNYCDKLKNKYSFYYSPAYLEEVANINTDDSTFIIDHLEKIDKLFEKNIFRPVLNGDIIPFSESAQQVYDRVIEAYDFTLLAEKNESELFELFKSERTKYEFQPKIVSNIEYNKIFCEPFVKRYIDTLNKSRSINCPEIYFDPKYNKQYLLNHRNTEALVNVLFNILEVIGYRSEKQKPSKIRSRIHDVSHAIYASKSQHFIVEDSKFREKCKAVYTILGVNTKIYSYEEFMNLNG